MIPIDKRAAALPIGPDAHVVIVGGGFSGALLAANIVRFGGPRLTLIEQEPARLARGVAYSATHPSQLLNVRAAGMSAFADEPAHFVDWLARQGISGHQFVARATYGRYLADTLAAATKTASARLAIAHGSATAVRAGPAVILDDGRAIAADAVVLTVGNLPPHAPPGVDPDRLAADVYLDDPWGSDPAAGLSGDDRIVLIGTGLTAIDVALKLDAAGFTGKIVALSRRGLAPRRHIDGAAPAKGLTEPPAGSLSQLVTSIRVAASADGWRTAVDALRPVTQHWWSRADETTRARFLRHLRPFWDVHRHRLAPAVADRIDAMVAAGRLSFAAGKIVSAEDDAAGASLSWRPRHREGLSTMTARRIVNCTGPQGDIARSREPLIQALVKNGLVRADVLKLGIDVNAQSQIIDARGHAHPDLYCIGPMTRGSFWEAVAVPDIRRQAADLARRLSNAQWVGDGL